MRLSQPLHLQTQHFVLHFRFDHPPHHIALGRPQMQHALIALPGDGILGLCQIKCHRAIFHHDGVSRPDEKVFDCSDQSFRVHITIIAGEYLFVCDE